MLDMTFQLLLFAMLWFRPSSLEGQMDLALPSEKPTTSQTNESKLPDTAVDDDTEDPKEPPEVTIIVTAVQANQGEDANDVGKIKEITVRLKEGATPILAEGADPDRLLAQLQEHLKKVRETLTNKNDVLMKSEKRLKWQYVVKVRDACQKAGFSNAHFSPPPDA
jgi:biopolymer transport protein ExbD